MKSVMGLVGAILLWVSPASGGGDPNRDAASKAPEAAAVSAPAVGDAASKAPGAAARPGPAVKGAKPAAKDAAPRTAPDDRPSQNQESDAVKAWRDADI